LAGVAQAAPNRRRPPRLSVIVLAIGLVVTGVLTASSRLSYLHNEQRLTNLQTSLTASALDVAPVDLERRLGEAVSVSAESSDPVATFRKSIAPSMAPGGPFVTATLVLVHDGAVQELTHIGAKSVKSPTGQAATALFKRAAKTTSLVTTRAVGPGVQRFGYLMSAVSPAGTLVASAGQALPGDRRVSIPASSPEAGLRVAIYFGRKATAAALVESNVARLPLTGTVSTATVPFGTSALTLVLSPNGALAGTWSEFLPWGILGVGLLFTLGIAVMTERLVRRRRRAELLADENRRLYREQRNVSVSLQRSLLPKKLPSIAGIELAARYIPGEAGTEVGGDWYSVIAVDDHRFAFVVGDVSGRGLAAASIMAGLRYTIRAYASLGYSPADILAMASKEISVDADQHFATVLVGQVDNERRELTMANAGHPVVLLLNKDQAEFVEVPTGVPLGIESGPYESRTIAIPPRSTLIAYTDGLIERRDEDIDVGMERLTTAARQDASSVDDLVERIVDDLLSGQATSDDTAILGIRWLD
jgi:serine phosphatase RsbU (regulator of sigma subunit)